MQFVVATENAGKLVEFQHILEPMGIVVVSLSTLGVTFTKPESGTTFAENARIKAVDIFEQTGLPTIADDSGLCVDALDGRPGVFSARYGKKGWADSERNNYLLEELEDVPQDQRTARFVCHITCKLAEEWYIDTEGVVEGHIGQIPLGESGFGYDPLFMVNEQSFGQMPELEKNKISHRGKALEEFSSLLRQQLSQYKEIL